MRWCGRVLHCASSHHRYPAKLLYLFYFYSTDGTKQKMKREIGFERSRIVTSIFEQQSVCLTIRAAKASERRKVHPVLFRHSQKQEVMKSPLCDVTKGRSPKSTSGSAPTSPTWQSFCPLRFCCLDFVPF